jgi:hypothetical protein
MSRKPKIRKRHFCEWIANPSAYRCPRAVRTGEECWCRPTTAEEDEAGWEWRIVPPFVGEEEQALKDIEERRLQWERERAQLAKDRRKYRLNEL